MDLRNFVRGVVCGGLIGDCYGYVYEDRPTVNFEIPLKLLRDTLTGTDSAQLVYTDDTQMGLATLRSLRWNGRLVPSHLAREYAEDYFKDGSHRYYGGTVPKVFYENARDNYQNPFWYPAMLFNGTGSFGNGGAMRVTPLALYGLKLSDDEFDKLVIDVTRLTHTHPLAICGALLQAYAVRHLWSTVSRPPGSCQLYPNQFLDQLLTRLRAVRYEFINWNDPKWKDAVISYKQKFETIKYLLAQYHDPSVTKVVQLLGHDVKAVNSVPVSLFAFLRSLKPIEGIPLTSIPLRCLVYSICLGGDTGSNAAMACSLAGGYVGLGPWQSGPDSPIPHKILSRCERLSTVNEMIDWLCARLGGSGAPSRMSRLSQFKN